MKIACLIPSLSRQAGGAHDSVRHLCRSLAAHPHTEVHVLGMTDEHTQDDLAGWAPAPVHTFPIRGPRRFGYAPGLQETLRDLDVDLLITHGLWMYPTVVAQAWHRRTGRPYLMNPHGMLEPWALRRSSYKKRLAGFLHENTTLKHAACLRALCEAETQSIRAYGLPNPICVIPNGVDLPEMRGVVARAFDAKPEHTRKTLLYLGRIHPKKGLANLLRAWARLHRHRSPCATGWDLVIAGWDQGGHARVLKKLAKELGIEQSVRFVGPRFGEAKEELFRSADAFILPSHSEGLPMTVLEAWAHGLPAILTPECHLPEGFEAKAALFADPVEPSLAHALLQLFTQGPAQREQMGRHGCRLVVDRFNWAAIGAQMHSVCGWLLGENRAPECILGGTTGHDRHRAPDEIARSRRRETVAVPQARHALTSAATIP